MRATRALIHLKAFAQNWNVLKNALPKEIKILPMVKANGYGHGTFLVANESRRLGALGVGVADIGEALILRQEGFTGEILALGGFTEKDLEPSLNRNIILTVHSSEEAATLSKTNSRVRAHLEIETGMNRLGLPKEEWQPVAEGLKKLSHVSVEALFTHLAESDAPGKTFTQEQIQTFEEAVRVFEQALGRKILRHAANSGGILRYPSAHFDWVRPGIALYGYPPRDPAINPALFAPVLEWRASIIQLKRIAPGDSVGYNRGFRATKPMTIATLAVGYGDGYRRGYSKVGVGYQGKRCPVLGLVCMDLMMIDVTPFQNVRVFDEVTLIGPAGSGAPNAQELAEADHTIVYEVLTSISRRVPRLALDEVND